MAENFLSFLRRSHDARILWSARQSAFLADQLGEIALIWLAWDLSRSSLAVGVVMFVYRMPLWAVGWLAGVVVDRHDKRALLILAFGVSAAICLIVFSLHAAGALSLTLLAALMFLLMSVRAAEFPAFAAQLSILATEKDYHLYNATLDNTKRVARLIAPLAAALLANFVNAPSYYVVLAGIYGVATYTMTRQRTLMSDRLTTANARRGLRADLQEGLAILSENRLLLLTFACFALYNIAYAAGVWVLLPRLSGVDLSGGLRGFSLAVAALAAGGLVGNLLFAHVKLADLALAVFVGFLVIGSGLALASAATSLALVGASIFVCGFALPLVDMATIALVNACVASNRQGRAFASFRYFAEAGIGAGLIVGGLLAEYFGARASLLAMGVALYPLVLFFMFATRSERMRAVAAKDVAHAR